MTDEEFEEQIAHALSEGYEIVQQRPVLAPPKVGLPFSERVDNFSIAMLGTYAPPDYRSQYKNLLYDTATRWVHLRKTA